MNKQNILVMDDELVMRDFLRDFLIDEGYNVTAVQNGKEGLNMLKGTPFDLVIVDLKLSGLDGVEVLKETKKIDPDIVVILVTGYGTLETAQEAIREGAFDYITKPFQLEKVSFAVKKALNSRILITASKRLMEELKEQNIKLEEKVEELSIFDKIMQEISSAVELKEVLKIIGERSCDFLGAEICSILLIEPNTDELSIKFAKGLDKKIIEKTRIKTGDQISGWVAQHKSPILVDDIEKDSRFKRRKQEKYYTKSFISIPLIIKDRTVGVINVNNKITKGRFKEDDLKFLERLAREVVNAHEKARAHRELQKKYLTTIIGLASAIDDKTHYTHQHSQNVSKYAEMIASEMKLSPKQTEIIKQAGRLHDIGKINIHDYILSKPGKLTEKEWRKIKQSPLKSVEILEPLEFLEEVKKLIRHHHEWYSGKGYPDGVKDVEIEMGSRIIAVADAFDAMISERPYRRRFTVDKAISEFKKYSGTQFDPKVVKAFLDLLKKNPEMLEKK